MEILETIAQVRALFDAARAEKKTIGIMGTSGAMHDGHLSLVRRTVEENDVALMFWLGDMKFSWAPSQAPRLYDRDRNRDLPMCKKLGLKYAYLPDGDDFYSRPPVTKTLVPKLSIDCPRMENPEHLNQVSTVTAKLFHIFGKCRYYSGEKDWQQLSIFKRMAIDLSAEIEMVGCKTIRDHDGLALSSRNMKLTPEDRHKAPGLYAALKAAAAAIENGERSSRAVQALMHERLNAVGEAVYAICVDAETLQPMETLHGDIRLIASLKLGIVPLVDNLGVRIG